MPLHESVTGVVYLDTCLYEHSCFGLEPKFADSIVFGNSTVRCISERS